MTTLFVLYQEESTEENRYGHWSKQYNFRVLGVQQGKPSSNYLEYEEFTVDFDVNQGDCVYVVTIYYSDGDSFGSSHGKGEPLWVFKDVEFAKKAAKAFEKQYNDFKVKIEVDGGRIVELYNPGAGYFESQERMEITSHIIGVNGVISFDD